MHIYYIILLNSSYTVRHKHIVQLVYILQPCRDTHIHACTYVVEEWMKWAQQVLALWRQRRQTTGLEDCWNEEAGSCQRG